MSVGVNLSQYERYELGDNVATGNIILVLSSIPMNHVYDHVYDAM